MAVCVTVCLAFLFGFMASHGILGSHGWAVALIVGAAISAAIGVAIVPLSRRGARGFRFHLPRR